MFPKLAPFSTLRIGLYLFYQKKIIAQFQKRAKIMWTFYVQIMLSKWKSYFNIGHPAFWQENENSPPQ